MAAAHSVHLCMLTAEEERFLVYWEKNSLQQKHSLRPFLVGLSAGLLLGVGLLLTIFSGWYERANMVASTRFNTAVFLLAILGISLFMAFVYRHFRWESREQQYRELLAKREAWKKKQASSSHPD